ncbi:mannose-6-phosphate isomerase [Novosphingobium sp. TH158]|nr:mannose-6-phosphate isomerase [Novosphingobium sp. TH158]
MVERPWGRHALPAPFTAPAGCKIGEVWFDPPAELSQLLVKYIFTSEALSVQVHPSDDQAPGQGKEECWLVIAADPGARLGVGFTRDIPPEAMRAAALDGSIEHLLEWHPVAAGDFFHIPPGTVHAIGPGIGLIEVQQNSDVTYRLYDYGRPRELHLDQGMKVARGEPYRRESHCRVPGSGSVTLVDGPRFRLDRLDGTGDARLAARYGERPLLVIPVSGSVRLAGETVGPGQCALAPALAALDPEPGAKLLIAQPA